jgi:hypothetical protein
MTDMSEAEPPFTVRLELGKAGEISRAYQDLQETYQARADIISRMTDLRQHLATLDSRIREKEARLAQVMDA